MKYSHFLLSLLLFMNFSFISGNILEELRLMDEYLEQEDVLIPQEYVAVKVGAVEWIKNFAQKCKKDELRGIMLQILREIEFANYWHNCDDAIIKKQISMVQILIDNGLEISHGCKRDDLVLPFLFTALRTKQFEIVKILLDNKAFIDGCCMELIKEDLEIRKWIVKYLISSKKKLVQIEQYNIFIS